MVNWQEHEMTLMYLFVIYLMMLSVTEFTASKYWTKMYREILKDVEKKGCSHLLTLVPPSRIFLP
jgi:hypothetical protein